VAYLGILAKLFAVLALLHVAQLHSESSIEKDEQLVGIQVAVVFSRPMSACQMGPSEKA